MTTEQTVKTFAKFLWQGYISIFWAPAKLLSDWCTHFESNIIKELYEFMGIWKVCTSSYHAQTKRQVEWTHQMLMHMIGKLSKTRRQIDLGIYQDWCMLTTLWGWPSLDIAHTTWCLGTDGAYLLTFTPLQWGEWRNTSVSIAMLLSYVNDCKKPSKKCMCSPCQRLRDRSNTIT